MKRLLLSIVFLLFFSFPCWGRETVEYFKELGHTIAFPYYYEGLWPVLNPRGEFHYVFVANEKRHPLRISYFNPKGKPVHTKHGWHTFKLIYDAKGNLLEATFYTVDGKMAFNKDLGFAKERREYDAKGERVSLFYDARDRKLPRSYEKDWRKRYKGLFP